MKAKFDIKRLGQDLNLQRKSKNLSLSQLAKKTKLPKATVFRLEKGKQKDIHVCTFIKVCNWMEIEPSIYFNFVRK